MTPSVKQVANLRKVGAKVLVPLGAMAAAGVAAGAKGAMDLAQSKKERKAAEWKHAKAIEKLDFSSSKAQDAAEKYGEYLIEVYDETVARFADWCRRHEAQVRQLQWQVVDGVRVEIRDIPEFVAGVEAYQQGFAGLAGGVGAGVAAKAGAVWGVKAFAAAGTGTKIAMLNGVAQQNAIVAAFGGGALNAGGGGMAVGGVVINAVAVAPALLVGGLAIGVVGAKSKSKVKKHVAQVNVEIERIALARDLIETVMTRIDEARSVVKRLRRRSIKALDKLESLDFDPEKHAVQFTCALQLVKATREVLEAPILDEETGELSESGLEIIRRYA